MERTSKKKSVKKIDDKKQDDNLQRKTKTKPRKNQSEDNTVTTIVKKVVTKSKKLSHFEDDVKHPPASAPKKVAHEKQSVSVNAPKKVSHFEDNIKHPPASAPKKLSHFEDDVKHAPVSISKKISSKTPSINNKSPRQIKKSPINKSPKEQNRILENGGYKISNRTPDRRNVLGNLVFLFGRGGLLKTLDSYSQNYPEYSNRFNEDKQWVKDNFKKQ